MKTKKNYLQNELEELLVKDLSLFNFIKDTALDGLWYWDLENPENEWMDERFWKLFGYEPDSKKHYVSEWQSMVHPEDLKIALENFNKHKEDPTFPYDQIVRYKHRQGHNIWVRCRGVIIRNEAGKPIRMLGSHSDYTEVISSKNKLKAVLDSSLDGIMTFDSVYDDKGEIIDFIFTFSNQRGCEIVSHTYNDLIGRRLSAVISGNFVPLDSLQGRTLFEEYKEVVTTGISKELEFYFDYDGIKEWFRAKAVKYENGFTVTFSVITKEKELESQDKLACKGMMLEAISHQWRQPLAQINSILFKMNYLLEDNRVEKEISEIEEITSFLSHTIDEFLDDMFIDGQKEIFSPKKLLDSLINLFNTSLNENMIIVHNNIDEKLLLNSYSTHLKHILFAVFQNSLEAFSNQKDKQIVFESKVEENKLLITIEDNAGGFHHGDILKVFEKNFTTKSYGTGIGLYLANLIILKVFNGKLFVKNTDVGFLAEIEIKVDENI